MKKSLIVFLLLALVSVPLLSAQEARSPQYDLNNKTNLGNMGLQGSSFDGNPGYLEVDGVSTKSGTRYSYYLWVDETGDLCLASYATISGYSSFPNGDWRQPNFKACTVVGGQS